MRRDRTNPHIMRPPEVSLDRPFDPMKGKLLDEQEEFYAKLYLKQKRREARLKRGNLK